jgi:DNA replication protein DnaC
MWKNQLFFGHVINQYRNALIIGSPGSGKTHLIHEIIDKQCGRETQVFVVSEIAAID